MVVFPTVNAGTSSLMFKVRTRRNVYVHEAEIIWSLHPFPDGTEDKSSDDKWTSTKSRALHTDDCSCVHPDRTFITNAWSKPRK